MSARRSVRAPAAAALCAVLSSCARKVPDPAEQFASALACVRAGDLAGAYRISIPESYARDLDGLLRRLGSLVSGEDVEVVAGLAARLGEELATALGEKAETDPAYREIAERARGLPEILGLDGAEAFRELGAAGLLARLDEGIFREVAKIPEIRAALERTSVRTVERRGNWARLRFLSRDAEGRESREDRDVVFVEGTWVLNDWCVDWPKYMQAWSASVEGWAKRAAEEPGWLRRALSPPERVIGELARTLAPTLRHFGGGAREEGASRNTR